MSVKQIRLRYFASVREALGVDGEAWTTTCATVGELRDELVARGGRHAEALGRARTLRVSLNQAMSEESATLADGAEVAFFPPVTGG
jgi:molybdopterin synthase sulfur carrier subunit